MPGPVVVDVATGCGQPCVVPFRHPTGEVRIMLLVDAWKTVVLGNYANFAGRARRPEFWHFFLANLIVSVVLNVLGQAADLFAILALVYGLAVLVPGIAVGVRRLHDIGKPGVWILIGLIPFVGTVILIVWWAQESAPGPNEYGV
jgi:uncharacterized membrane protein YhaH (DUF805 family)